MNSGSFWIWGVGATKGILGYRVYTSIYGLSSSNHTFGACWFVSTLGDCLVLAIRSSEILFLHTRASYKWVSASKYCCALLCCLHWSVCIKLWCQSHCWLHDIFMFEGSCICYSCLLFCLDKNLVAIVVLWGCSDLPAVTGVFTCMHLHPGLMWNCMVQPTGANNILL